VLLGFVDRERASRALSIPVACNSAPFLFEGVESRSPRSRVPRDFLGADFEAFGLDFWEASSAARRASLSAFLRAASAFLASACSLKRVGGLVEFF
jgi:hypothetical protein